MGELANVLAVDLEFLPSYGVSRPAICANRLGSLCAARPQGVEEFVLSFRRVGCEGWCRASVLLLQIVPLTFFSNALPSSRPTYLYACVLRSEVDCTVVGRVCDAENVSDIIG